MPLETRKCTKVGTFERIKNNFRKYNENMIQLTTAKTYMN